MIRISLLCVALATTGVAACAPTSENQRSANCIVGTAGGAALGGIVGNQFGGGTGKTLATAAGATAGGLAGASAACQ